MKRRLQPGEEEATAVVSNEGRGREAAAIKRKRKREKREMAAQQERSWLSVGLQARGRGGGGGGGVGKRRWWQLGAPSWRGERAWVVAAIDRGKKIRVRVLIRVRILIWEKG